MKATRQEVMLTGIQMKMNQIPLSKTNISPGFLKNGNPVQ